MSDKAVASVAALPALARVLPAYAQGPDMGFVADATVPDDAVLEPGERFAKTSRLRVEPT